MALLIVVLFILLRADAIYKLLPLSPSLSMVSKNFDYRKILIIISDYVNNHAHATAWGIALFSFFIYFSFYFSIFILGFQTHKSALSDRSENCRELTGNWRVEALSMGRGEGGAT